MLEKSDLVLARFALFSLSYCTKATLADDELAADFFRTLRTTVAKGLLPDPYDTEKLIAFARMGDDNLTKALSDFKNYNP